jgi:hypothetical protein
MRHRKVFIAKRTIAIAAAIVLTVLTAASDRADAALVLDDFNDNMLDGSIWTDLSSGVGTAQETNQRYEISFPDDRGLASGSALLISRSSFEGDFDFELSFELIEFPSFTGARVQLVASPLFWMEAVAGDQTYYFSNLGAGPAMIPTGDTSGKLRITRVADTATSYYWDGSDWVVVTTRTGVSTQDVTFNVGASVEGVAGNEPTPFVHVAVDDAIVNAGNLSLYKNGDVDCNGEVNHWDALDVVAAEAGVPNIWEDCLSIGENIAQPASEGHSGPTIFGDVNCDETADAQDIFAILQFVAGLQTGLPGDCTPVNDFIQLEA